MDNHSLIHETLDRIIHRLESDLQLDPANGLRWFQQWLERDLVDHLTDITDHAYQRGRYDGEQYQLNQNLSQEYSEEE